jgi:peptidoglycan lytic transglycosylase
MTGQRAPARRRGAPKRGRSRTGGRSHWRLLAGTVAVSAGIVAGALLGLFGDVDHAIQELTLPLRHEDVIRQQAAEKGVDAALIAAVIYSESRFSDQTSSAGARGLMQITPAAARDIERHSGGTTFNLGDLSDPEINIRYGTYQLRELLDRYNGDVVAALAAYNAGPGNVDKWGGAGLTVGDIPFSETRGYVEEVLEKQRAYREKYPRELGY